MRKKIIFLVIILAVLAFFGVAYRFSQKTPIAVETKPGEPLVVSVQNLADSHVLLQDLQYPAVTAGDQEITLTARTSGTLISKNFNLGSRVSEGMQLAIIDSIGNFSKFGEKELKDSQIQALELAVTSTEEKYKSAKYTYDHDKTYANKKAKEVAEIDLQTARINLRGALDARFIVSPISGVVTQNFVSEGDSVSAGQVLAKISKTNLTKVQFFVNKEELPAFKIGMNIQINEGSNEIGGVVSRISPTADPATRRFLIEAKPQGSTPLLIGNVIYVSFQITKSASTAGNILLPLSAITVGQNENFIFIADNNQAKKVNIQIIDVIGEAAEIRANLPDNSQIITEGAKLVQDGDSITIQ